jgi:hypothetical protein
MKKRKTRKKGDKRERGKEVKTLITSGLQIKFIYFIFIPKHIMFSTTKIKVFRGEKH